MERVKWYAIAASTINLFVRRCTANSRFYASAWICVTKRTTYIRYRMERRDWYTFSYLSILFIIAIICSNYGGGKLIIYPKVESILFQQYDGIMFAVFTMFISLPIIMEGREAMVAHAEINNLSFVYADENEYALQHISFYSKGEFIVLRRIRVREDDFIKTF